MFFVVSVVYYARESTGEMAPLEGGVETADAYGPLAAERSRNVCGMEYLHESGSASLGA